MLDFSNHQIHESPSRRLERQVRAMRPKATWLPARGFVFQDVNGTTPAKEFGDPLGLVLDYFKGRMRGSELLNTGWIRQDVNIAITEDTGTSVSFTRTDISTYVYLPITTEAGKLYDVPWTGTANTSVQVRDQTHGGAFITHQTSSFQFVALSDTTVIRLQTDDPSASFTASVREIPGIALRQPAANSRPTLGIELGNSRGPNSVVNGGLATDLSGWVPTNAIWDNGARVVNGNIMQGGICPAGELVTLEVSWTQTINSGTRSRVRFRNAAGNNDVNGNIYYNGTGSFSAQFETSEGLSLWMQAEATNDVTFKDIEVRQIRRTGPRSMQFDGLDDFLDATGLTAATGPKTVIAGVVTEDGESVPLQYLMDVQSGRAVYAAVGTTAGFARLFDGSWSSAVNYDSEALSTLTFKHYSSGGGIRSNGSDSLVENFAEVEWGGRIYVGASQDLSGGFLNGKIYVLLVFDRALTAFETWICERWVAQIMGEML